VTVPEGVAIRVVSKHEFLLSKPLSVNDLRGWVRLDGGRYGQRRKENMVDFNASMARLMAEVVSKVGEFQHIRVDQVLVSATFNRSHRRSGLLAYVLPLKYRAGSPVERRVRGAREYHWAMLPQMQNGVEVLYILYFMLPRFLHLSTREKLETVVHELYHISPLFNGDLRRFRGRSVLHGTLKSYDETVKKLTDEFMSTRHDASLYDFLSVPRHSEHLVDAKHIPEPRPKLLKVALCPSA